MTQCSRRSSFSFKHLISSHFFPASHSNHSDSILLTSSKARKKCVLFITTRTPSITWMSYFQFRTNYQNQVFQLMSSSTRLDLNKWNPRRHLVQADNGTSSWQREFMDKLTSAFVVFVSLVISAWFVHNQSSQVHLESWLSTRLGSVMVVNFVRCITEQAGLNLLLRD